MEKIIKIEEEGNYYDGYKIHTNSQVIEIGISNNQNCCETWGYMVSEDDLSFFIGSKIQSISLTDTALNTRIVVDDVEEGLSIEKRVMFVTLETDRGPLQFAVYNTHNGYYGHDAFVKSKQLNHNETL